MVVLLTGIFTSAQVIFKTIAPSDPVVAGISFNIQYIIEENSTSQFKPPSFAPFLLIDGPQNYDASTGDKKLVNHIYTLVAQQPGNYSLPGASAVYKGAVVHSETSSIKVIAAPVLDGTNKNAFTPVALLPGEDPQKKLKDNIFLKVETNTKSCRVGEPVVLTYQLYSALQSHSEIARNPAFYGFTAIDMINLDDKVIEKKMVNGREFTVHTVRKVQLYPLQAGNYIIDAMQIMNRVSFTRSNTIQQEVTEAGGNTDDKSFPYESVSTVSPLTIHVDPLPEKKPDDYDGAVGQFTINARLEKDKLDKNEEGKLIITINGQGNFIQVAAPSVNWPVGIEGFDSSVTDRTERRAVPLNGNREFSYSFISTKAGDYTIPSVAFTYFDNNTNQFKTIRTDSLAVAVSNKEKPAQELNKQTIEGESRSWWLIGVIIAALAALIAYVALEGKKPKLLSKPAGKSSVDSFFTTITDETLATDRSFYTQLQKSIWDYFADRLTINAATTGTYTLERLLVNKAISEDHRIDIINILKECEAGLFTEASLETDKEELLQRTIDLLQKIDDQLA